MSATPHRPKTVIQLFTVQQVQNNTLIRSFDLQTDFPMPVPGVGQRVQYGPSNNQGGDGQAIIGIVQNVQQNVDVSGDRLRFSAVITVN